MKTLRTVCVSVLICLAVNFGLLLCGSGCGTMQNMNRGPYIGGGHGKKYIYGGVGTCVYKCASAIADGVAGPLEGEWKPGARAGHMLGHTVEAGFWAFDVPMSFVADTITLRKTVPATLFGDEEETPDIVPVEFAKPVPPEYETPIDPPAAPIPAEEDKGDFAPLGFEPTPTMTRSRTEPRR